MDLEMVAMVLYQMNGFAWYGRNLGDWNDPDSKISGNEFEKDRWRRQAEYLANEVLVIY